MLRSLFSGVSGMKNQQTKMDVIGNNIANANTTAFKASRVTFKDMLSQTMQSASSPTTSTGGTNPRQVGLGMAIAAIDTDMSQGALQPTARATDLALQGNGFFVVKSGNDRLYTRDGSFTLDKNGDLLTSEGLHVVGVNKQDINSEYINIPLEHDIVPPFTLKEGSPAKEVFRVKIYGFDGQDITQVDVKKTTATPIKVNGKSLNKMIELSGTAPSQTLTINTNGITDITELEKQVNKFLSEVKNLDYSTLGDTNKNDSSLKAIRDLIDKKGISNITLTGNISDLTSAATAKYDADPAKTDIKIEKVKLTSFGIEKNGSIKAIYGEDVFDVGEIKIATFQNPAGLEKSGGNLFRESANSGQAQVGAPGDKGFGTIEQGYLEMSKVDLANEFTEMIITSRAFQANSKTITTSDEMLQELLNLKR